MPAPMIRGLVVLALLLAASTVSAQPARVRARVIRQLARSTVELRAGGSLGTGFVAGEPRWIVTTHCVVAEVIRAHPWGDAFVDVLYASGTRRRARVLRADVAHDLALLEIEGHTPAPPLPLAAVTLALGQGVLALGSLHGLTGTLSEGTVSMPSAGSRAHAPAVSDLLRSDAPLGPGSAGSPLVDARGDVVGVSVANDRLDPRMSFAVPVSYVRAFLDDVRAARAAGLAGLTPPGLDELGIRGESDLLGVHVMQVEPGSPADRAGLVGADTPMDVGVSRSGIPIGHVITALDGQPTLTVADLALALNGCGRGQLHHLALRGNPDPRSGASDAPFMFDLPP
jgi:S1-C subfamily serine protease